jgi:hypothetical protein
MKTLILILLVLFLAGAALVHFFPEKVEPFVEQTPLKELVATSKPVYQWRDESGGLQVTDEPPPEGIPYEVKQYALDANLLPSLKEER